MNHDTMFYKFLNLLVRTGKNLKEELSGLEERLVQITDKLQFEAQCIPNLTHPDVPIGGEEASVMRNMVSISQNISLFT